MAQTETFSSLGKFESIRRLYEGTGYTPFEPVTSFVPARGSHVRTASRVMLEGVDFDLVYFPLKHLGYKAVVAVSAELTSALARPRVLSLRLGVSAKLDFSHISELWGGVVSAAKEFGYKSVSLDLQPSRNGLTIAASAVGETYQLTLKRTPEPQTKDLLCVSGPLGAAYMGLRLLERERVRFENGGSGKSESLEQYKMIVGDYLKPELSAGIIAAVEETGLIPSLGVCVSRGLSEAVMSLCDRCGLGAKVYADKIPFEGGSFSLGEELDIDPVSAAMNGGEDYRVLFAVPILSLEKFRKDFQVFDIIGHLARPEVGAVLVTPDGVELPLKTQGR